MTGEAANVAMMMQGTTGGEQEEEAKDSQMTEMAATSDSQLDSQSTNQPEYQTTLFQGSFSPTQQ